MSSSAAAIISQEFLENCLTVSAQALCCYDFCLTFTRELKFMWKLKPSAGALLFFTLRYPAILNTIMVVFGYLSWGNWQSQLVSIPLISTPNAILRLLNGTFHLQTCTVMMRLEMAGDVLILTSSTSMFFTALRIYALSARNHWTLAWMLVLGLVNPVMSTYTFVLSAPYLAHVTPHYQTCDIDTQLLGDIGTRDCPCSGVIFDAVALVLTWKSIKRVTRANSQAAVHEASHRSGSSAGYGTLSLVLMRDTAVYFGFLLAINGLGIAIGLSHPKAIPRLDLDMECSDDVNPAQSLDA
ncbi:hypothetical protein C8Q72DRAFT_911806 [Fomitopsis betulina]|nr:hypothetical protein C8Q72DRAFT_911806 [Fomitopsis betulina]